MIRRTTIEIEEELLARAKRALGVTTTRAAVEEALRRAAEQAEGDGAARACRQQDYLQQLPSYVDPTALASDDMWR